MRRTLIFVLGGGLLTGAAFTLTTQARTPIRDTTVIVGKPVQGHTAFELIGHVDQNDNNLNGAGYLNHVAGISDAALFSSATRSAATARFTYTATGAIHGRYVLNNVIVTDSTEVVKIAFEHQPIATLDVRFQDMLNVQAPDLGIETGAGDSRQVSALTFHFAQHVVQLGKMALSERFSTTGEGKRTQVSPPQSSFVIAGNAVTTM